MLRLMAFLIFAFLPCTIFAHINTVITGVVTDKSTGIALPNSNVSVIGTTIGAAADTDGTFIINNLPYGTYSIKATRIGYKEVVKRDVKIHSTSKLIINFELEPKTIELSDVEIEASRLSDKYPEEVSRICIQDINPRGVPKIPGSLDDITRVVHIYGSAIPSSDYTSFFAVRGGSPDQNLVVFNGVVVPNPYRLRLVMGGGMSIFNPYTIDNVYLHVGGFPAEYGNFLSSILEVNAKSGRRDRIVSKASVNILDATAVIEGPLLNRKGSWIVSGRRTYFDLAANRYLEHQAAYPYTYDLTGKIVYDINNRLQLSVNSLKCIEGTDVATESYSGVGIDEQSKILLLSIHMDNRLSQKISQHFIFSQYTEEFSYNFYSNSNLEKKVEGEYESTVHDYTIKENFIFRFNKNHRINRGINFSTYNTAMMFNPATKSIAFARRYLPPKIDFREVNSHIANYIEYVGDFASRFQTKLGYRYDYSNLLKKSDTSIRFNFLYRITQSLNVNGFIGSCYQYPNVLNVFNRDIPLDLAVDMDKLRPEKAMHCTLGFKNSWANRYLLKFEMYYKDIKQLLLPKDYQSFIPENSGIGFAKGIELLLEKKASSNDRVSAIFSYSYGVSKYKIAGTNAWKPFNYDRRHGFSAMTDLHLLRFLSCSVLYRYATGLPYYDVIAFVESVGNYGRFVKDNENPKRLPAYSRLDFRINYSYTSGHRQFTIYVDISNILNRNNIYDKMWGISSNKDEFGDVLYQEFQTRTVSMLPTVPSFGFSFTF